MISFLNSSSGPGGITDTGPGGFYTNGGGGGGGVLVDGAGPVVPGVQDPHGIGYGAGGGGHVCCVDEPTLVGYQGVIVLDFAL